MKPFVLLAGAIFLAGCQPQSSVRSIASGEAPRDAAFIQASCGGCHALDLFGASPNPNAPPFAAIANQQGLTAETLRDWLRNAHNYPEEMEFHLDGPEVDELVAYILTLQDPAYRPAI